VESTFHARVQTISYLTTEDGEVQQTEFHHHKDDFKAFYQRSLRRNR